MGNQTDDGPHWLP